MNNNSVNKQDTIKAVVGNGKENIKALKASMIPVKGLSIRILLYLPRFAPEYITGLKNKLN